MEKMTIRNLAMDPILERPIVLLTNSKGDRIVPIWVGVFEANAILIELEKLTPPRPITHDLMKQMIIEMGGRVERIVISDLTNGVYYSIIELMQGEKKLKLDSRPSDAIAIALRFNAPIFVTNSVLEKSSAVEHGAVMVEDDEMRKWINKLKPGDFEKPDID